MLIGRRSDVQAVGYLFRRLARAIDDLAGEALAAGVVSGRLGGSSFRHGAVETVLKRVNQARRSVIAESRAAGQTRALARIDRRDADAERWIAERLAAGDPLPTGCDRSRRIVSGRGPPRGNQRDAAPAVGVAPARAALAAQDRWRADPAAARDRRVSCHAPLDPA